jgi:nitric oxide reductase large subunit
MILQPHPGLFHIFFATWIGLMVLGFVLFRGINDVALKNKIWPLWIVFIGILFIAFTTLMAGHVSWFAIAAVGGISYLNIRNQRFCAACGSQQFNRNLFQPQNFCSKCGAALPP